MRARWLTAAFLPVVLTVVWVVASSAAERPAERVSPAPEVNAQAVIWRTPGPPEQPQAGDIWVNPKGGMEMVYVPPGEFILGTSDVQVGALLRENRTAKREWFRGEQPQCRVRLGGYWIGCTEVTNGEYLRFVQATGHGMPRYWTGGQIPAGSEELPVIVLWDDAVAYSEWANGRLPSELEWEKAARGTDGRIYPWGDKWDEKRCRHGTRTGNKVHWPGLAAVGSSPGDVSPYGCFDMASNLQEWCAAWYDKKVYGRYAEGNLTPPADGTERVLRGGCSYHIPPRAFRCAARSAHDPKGGFAIVPYGMAAEDFVGSTGIRYVCNTGAPAGSTSSVTTSPSADTRQPTQQDPAR